MESNPLIGGVIDKFGYTGLYALKLGVVARTVIDADATENYYERERMLVALALFGALPAVNNLVVLRA